MKSASRRSSSRDIKSRSKSSSKKSFSSKSSSISQPNNQSSSAPGTRQKSSGDVNSKTSVKAAGEKRINDKTKSVKKSTTQKGPAKKSPPSNKSNNSGANNEDDDEELKTDGNHYTFQEAQFEGRAVSLDGTREFVITMDKGGIKINGKVYFGQSIIVENANLWLNDPDI
jgi:hypothetical protein